MIIKIENKNGKEVYKKIDNEVKSSFSIKKFINYSW